MERDKKVSRTELVKDGWVFITRFGNDQAWGKGIDRIMWNPDTELVIFAYNHERASK